MKLFITAIILLFSIAAYSQKRNFIGEYEQRKVGDTNIYIYLSYDSVKQIQAIRTKKSNNLLLQIKCGTWRIEDNSVRYSYKGIFTFNDGSVKEVVFLPNYNNIPTSDSIPPDGYSMEINGMSYTNKHGNNGFWERVKKSVKGSQL